MEKPVFIATDGQVIINEIVALYESLTGKTLQPAQPERLILNTIAQRELLLRLAIQGVGEQNLVGFATAPVLDYLAELVGVTRLPGEFSVCTIEFTLDEGHPGATIPEGTRIQTTDNQATFVTLEEVIVAAGVTTASVSAEADTPGIFANGYLAGQVSSILDPVAFVESAANTDTTAGGTDAESDERLRGRIVLAPSSYSTAGPRDAYRFFALSADASIIDVYVISPAPGEVQIYPLIEGGIVTPAEILTKVDEACSDDKVRPLTDSVTVTSPTKIEYSIVAEVTTLISANTDDVLLAVEAALEVFTLDRQRTLGKDALANQVRSAIMAVAGVYDVSLTGYTDVLVGASQFAVCTSITVNDAGQADG